MPFRPGAQCGQLPELGIAQGRPGIRPESDPLGASPGERPDGDSLVAGPPFQDLAGGRVHHEVVRIHRPGNHGLAQSGTGIDDGLMAPSRHRVRGEQDPRHGGIHHALDHHRERHS
ncbi:hypothetical protein D9M72_622310 [compost metagenome]